MLQGAIIGIGGILPGISGGILCVIFGLYQMVIEVLSHPIASIRRHWKLIFPMAVGVGISFLGCAGLVSSFMERNSQAAVSVFVGLIFGMLPSLWRDAKKQGQSKGSLAAMIFSFVIFSLILLYLQQGISFSITPNLGWYGVCGVAWGLSIIVPGLSSSSMLIYLGLYQPMLSGMARFDMTVIVPLALGACVVVFTLSRVVDRLFSRHYSIASHSIIGIVLATTIPIIPRTFDSVQEFLLVLVCIGCGIIAAIGINYICQRIAADKAPSNHNV